MITIKEHCCGADMFFDKKTAAREYRTYLKKGPSRVTARIIKQLESQDVTGKTMIDVGGGIGALQWWFLHNGGTQTIDIDASTGYLSQAENHAIENDWQDKTRFFEGDCTEVYDQIENADYITLDKVVCCYPNYKEILESTCDKSISHVSLSYPMDGMIAQAIASLGGLFFMLMNNPYRPFVHPVSKIRGVFAAKGYQRIFHSKAFPWHIETYIKST
jgi:2-polyprenyl-3-methyl-5-hydroxy-6-metoxy-1,4-benzoquinol methylase